jgi:triosephosphate isomerase
MHKTVKEARILAKDLLKKLCSIKQMDLVLCPPFTALAAVYEIIRHSNIKLGAQDTYWQNQGAFTGEISPLMLKDVGCEFVIIGHSERRLLFAETNESVNKKIKAVLEYNLTPIVCIGETLQQRQEGKTFDIVKKQIEEGLSGLSSPQILKLLIAYEPVWAIGTGRTATPMQAQQVQGYIRSLLQGLYDKDTAQRIRIQYGGSVKPANAAELMRQSDIDGALVGGASLDAESFAQIIEQAKGVVK